MKTFVTTNLIRKLNIDTIEKLTKGKELKLFKHQPQASSLSKSKGSKQLCEKLMK